MSDQTIIACLGLFIVMIRCKSLYRLWNIPHAFGAGRFFGLPVPAHAVPVLLRRYHAWLLLPFLPEVVLVAALAWWGTLRVLVLQQTITCVLVSVYHSFVAAWFARKGKWLAVADNWKPVAGVALSLRVRRLADYTNPLFELVLVVATATALALIASTYPIEGGVDPLPTILWLFQYPLLLIYVQLGGLLLKHGLVRWRQWLPGQRTEEFVRWRDEVVKFFVWGCDFIRGLCTVALVWDAVVVKYEDTWGPDGIERKVGLLLVLGVVGAGLVGLVRRQRRLRALQQQLQPVDAFAAPPRVINPQEFFLGGLAYYNPENPTVIVPGPLVLALNFANLRTYVYTAYLAGLLLQGIWLFGFTTV